MDTCHRMRFKPDTSLMRVKCAVLWKPARLLFWNKTLHILHRRNSDNRHKTRHPLCKWHPVLPTMPWNGCKKISATVRTIHYDTERSNRPCPETRLFPWQWPSGFRGARRDPLPPLSALPMFRLSIVLRVGTCLGHGQTKQTHPSEVKVLFRVVILWTQ